MNKVLLLNPPGKRKFIRDQYCSSSAKADYYWPAVDLLVLSGILSKEFKIEFIDAIASDISPAEVLKKITNSDFCALISLASCASFDQDIAFLKQVRQVSDLKIIVNGGIFRHSPEMYLEEYDCIDAVITDYIENGIVDFLKKKAGQFRGLWYKCGDKIIKPDAGDTSREFSYPVPRHELLDLKAYKIPQSVSHPFTSCLISYGCNFNCEYCASRSIGFRLRSVDNIIEELKYIKSLGIKEVHFPDFTFNASRKHCIALAEAMKENKISLSWDCLARADLFDEELAVRLKSAGLHTVQFGVETGNEKERYSLSKPISNKQIRKSFEICRKLGIQTIGFFIIGFPGQSEKSILETIDFACELDCDWASFSIYVPDAGSAIFVKLAKKDPGILSLRNFDRTGFPVIDNGVLSKEKIWQLRNMALKRFYLRPEYVIRQIVKVRNLKKLKTIGRMAFSLLKNS